MKKFAILCIAVMGAALMVVATAPAASAYPDLSCHVTVDKQTVGSGEEFTVTGEATVVDDGASRAAADEITWEFTFNGVTKQRTGSPASATFTAPEVTGTEVFRLTAKSNSPAGACESGVDITVLGGIVAGPEPDGGDGLLPNTGGPEFWLLVGGVLLLLAGGTAVALTRRRGEQV